MAEIKQAHTMALESLVEAAKASAACANAEPDLDCARVCRDAADLAWFGASLLARGSHFMAIVMRGVAEALDLCGKSCVSHAHGHCQRCAVACQRAAGDLRRLLGELPIGGTAAGQWASGTKSA